MPEIIPSMYLEGLVKKDRFNLKLERINQIAKWVRKKDAYINNGERDPVANDKEKDEKEITSDITRKER